MAQRVQLPILVLVALAGVAGAAGPKSLVFCIDGLRADAVGPASTPSIARLAEGRWAPAPHALLTTRAHTIPDAPTLSGPNHTAILTGVTADRHGVRSNAPTELAAMAFPDYLALLEQRRPSLVTRKLVAWAPEELLPSGADRVVVAPDATILADAERTLGGDVDALFVFVDGPDAAGHAEGYASVSYRDAVAVADRGLGRLLDAIAARPSLAAEDWQVVVTTDHGGIERTHGGPSDAETTIPFLVASRHVPEGAPATGVRNVDVAPTVLAHFGIDPVAAIAREGVRPSYHLDGVARVPVTPR